MMHIISLGAGVQSTAMALLAAHGEITPMPDCAIFADTKSEPAAVYRHLDWLETQLPFPVHRVSSGSLREGMVSPMRGKKGANGRIPMHIANKDGSKGMTIRGCTQHYKIVPIERKLRELAGVAKGSRGPKEPCVEQWIGISSDEAIRMKPSRRRWIKHRWPLIEREMARHHCLEWLERHGYPKPHKSACTFCPYHSDASWRDLKDNSPADWADAVAVDHALRAGDMLIFGVPYLHASLKPLDQVDLSTLEDHGQLNLFNNECEGMCGV
jgi:hypothetical protein